MIICAATKFYIEETGKEVVIPCWRHGNAYRILEALGFGPKKGYKEIEQGFLTNEGIFLNRRLAYNHALGCGQISQSARRYKKDHEANYFNDSVVELFSEDIY